MQQKYEIEELQPYESQQNCFPNVHPNNSLDSSANNSQVMQQLMMENTSIHKQKDRYGNIRILYENSRFLFTIGPDFMCFSIAYVMFIIMSLAIIYTVATQIHNTYLNISNIVYAIFQNLSYLAVALSNPGIQTNDTIPTEEDVSDEIKRFCKKCSIRMQKGTHHCRDCDVCIRNYDHHCPWTSKCIGEKNLSKFYVFVTTTITYLIYCLILMLFCSAKNAIDIQDKLNGKTV